MKPSLKDIQERKGDKILFQHPNRCNHPQEWCIAHTNLLDQTYYHCYKCNTDIDKELVGTAPWNRAE